VRELGSTFKAVAEGNHFATAVRMQQEYLKLYRKPSILCSKDENS
jgi:hypothetical protein